MNPVMKQKGVGRNGAVRRALQGMAAMGDAAARELLKNAWAEKKQKGTWPDLAIPFLQMTTPNAVDTPGWSNGSGHSCESYGALGWCADGHFIEGFEWTG